MSVVPQGVGATYSEIRWGDGAVTPIFGGWNSATPPSLTTHAYAAHGSYRIEYVTQFGDGSFDVRSMAVVVMGAGSASPPTQPGGCGTGGVRRVLFVGNSQIDVQNVPQIVSSIAESAAPECPRITTGSVTLGGANLRDLWAMGGIQAALGSGLYDTVVVAESIDLADPFDPRYPGDFYSTAKSIIDLARSRGVTPILYATPNVLGPSMEAGFADMATFNAALGRELGVTVATGGLAWLRTWTVQPLLRLHGDDDAHANYVGAVLSSYVLYSAITNASPVGLATQPATDACGADCPTISSSTAAAMQQAAWTEYLTNGRVGGSGASQKPMRAPLRKR